MVASQWLQLNMIYSQTASKALHLVPKWLGFLRLLKETLSLSLICVPQGEAVSDSLFPGASLQTSPLPQTFIHFILSFYTCLLPLAPLSPLGPQTDVSIPQTLESGFVDLSTQYGHLCED